MMLNQTDGEGQRRWCQEGAIAKKTSRKEEREEGKSKEAGDATWPSCFSPVTSGGKGEGAVTVTTVVSVVIMVVVWLLVVGEVLSALQT